MFYIKSVITLISLLVVNTVSAAVIDLTGAGSNGGGYGNSLQFQEDDISVTVSAYGETGSENPVGSYYYLFETAEVYSWNSGLGVCNQSEGLAHSSCRFNEHEVDTVGRDDLLVFEFDQTVDFNSITVDPYRNWINDPNDRDIIYWIGQSSSLPDLTQETFNTLSSLTGFSDETRSPAREGYSSYTHALLGTGNILLVSGNYHNLGCKSYNSFFGDECEAYKITSLEVSAASPVPVPAAFWLFMSALVPVVMRKISV